MLKGQEDMIYQWQNQKWNSASFLSQKTLDGTSSFKKWESKDLDSIGIPSPGSWFLRFVSLSFASNFLHI